MKILIRFRDTLSEESYDFIHGVEFGRELKPTKERILI